MPQSRDRYRYIAERLSPLSKYRVFPERYYIINHRYKFIYCPIPKVACTSIKQAILDLTDADSSVDNIHLYVHNRFSLGIYHHEDARKFLNDSNYFKFAFIRNPWTRIASAYVSKFVYPIMGLLAQFAREVIEKIYYDCGLEPNYEKSITFKQFVKYLVANEDRQLDFHWLPQHLFLSKNYALDFIGKFENIEQDFKHIQQKLKFEIELPWENKSYARVELPKGEKEFYEYYPNELRQLPNIPQYKQFYNSDLIDAIGEKYNRDVAIFNYKFN